VSSHDPCRLRPDRPRRCATRPVPRPGLRGPVHSQRARPETDGPRIFALARRDSDTQTGSPVPDATASIAMFAIAAHADEREAHVREVERSGQNLPEGSYGRRNRQAIAARETRVAPRAPRRRARLLRRDRARHRVRAARARPGIRSPERPATGRSSLSKRPANPYQTIADRAVTRCQPHGGWAMSERYVRSGDSEFTPAEEPFVINPRSRADMVRPIRGPDWLVSLSSRHPGSGKRGSPIRIGGVPPGNGGPGGLCKTLLLLANGSPPGMY
jgi:hypothetical protein